MILQKNININCSKNLGYDYFDNLTNSGNDDILINNGYTYSKITMMSKFMYWTKNNKQASTIIICVYYYNCTSDNGQIIVIEWLLN